MPRLDTLQGALVYNAPEHALTRTCKLFANPELHPTQE